MGELERPTLVITREDVRGLQNPSPALQDIFVYMESCARARMLL